MRPHGKRAALLLIACLIASQIVACSKPIDPQSSVPSVYQPLVFVAVAVGVGIYIASNSHKNNTSGGSPQPTPAPTTPAFVGTFPSLAHPFDLSLDFSTAGSGGVGAVGTQTVGYGFSEIGSAGPDNGTYALPSGYVPAALAIDGNGADWFVDINGRVDKCAAATSAITTCSPALSFVDGLGSGGIRSIAADAGRVFIARDNLAGTVSWVAYALDGSSKVTGSYVYSGESMYNADAAMATLGAIGIYNIFHKDGASWKVTIAASTKSPYSFSPVPLASGNMASDGLGNNYGLLGSATAGGYQLGHYVSPGNSSGAPGQLVSKVTIAVNGQTSVNVPPFRPPVSSLHTDDVYIFMLDANGQLVLFASF